MNEWVGKSVREAHYSGDRVALHCLGRKFSDPQACATTTLWSDWKKSRSASQSRRDNGKAKDRNWPPSLGVCNLGIRHCIIFMGHCDKDHGIKPRTHVLEWGKDRRRVAVVETAGYDLCIVWWSRCASLFFENQSSHWFGCRPEKGI